MPDLLEPADPGSGYRPLIAVDSHPIESVPTVADQSVALVPPVLVFERVSKWYGPVLGLNQVSLELRPGITGLVGHNGAGKSTLLRLAAGQLRPELGRVLIAGHEAWSPKAKMHVGYCPELDYFYEEMSGRRFILTMAKLCGFGRSESKRRTEETLNLVGMRDRADRPLAGYSKGMRQRIKLAQALLHDPELLLLDEPLSGVDPVGRRESVRLFRLLAERGKCLLISSHELEELDKLTDQVAIVAAGRIAAIGDIPRIRSLLDQHPLSIRVVSDRMLELTRSLLDYDDLVGLDREGEETVVVRVRHPRRFYRKLSDLVLEEHFDIRRIEALDESTQDVLEYLLKPH